MSDPSTRRRRRKQPADGGGFNSVLCVASLVVLYLLFLFQTASVLDTVEENNSGNFRFHGFLYDDRKNDNKVRRRSAKEDADLLPLDSERYLLFVGNLPGQGTGNIISGLLSAHLLGEEFNRIVCVKDYPTFTQLFDMAHPVTIEKCPAIMSAKYPPADSSDHITLINYVAPPDECELQNKLKSDTLILFLTGNTYPRWPTVPDNFFFKYYKAKPQLLEALPYNPQSPPTTVVHLREPDSKSGDPRKGLDDESLRVLGDLLPKGSSTYLVTNNIVYYKRFEQCCQWSHPVWDTVVHSANMHEWGPNPGGKKDAAAKAKQNEQMWADWYTILTAKTVYHTHSDFSISAIHWTNKVDSHNLQGLNKDGSLYSVRESWWVDGETEPLSQRTRTASGTAQLRLCKHVRR